MEAVFPAGERQHDGVRRGLADEFRVVIPSCARAVTAADQEEVADRAGAHGLDDLRGVCQHGVVRKARGRARAAVQAGAVLCLGIAAQLQCALDDRRSVSI